MDTQSRSTDQTLHQSESDGIHVRAGSSEKNLRVSVHRTSFPLRAVRNPGGAPECGPRLTKGKRGKIVSISLFVLMSVGAGIHPAYAQSSTTTYVFDFEGGTLGEALDMFFFQTGLQILYPHELVNTTGLNPVEGRHSVDEALDIMLRGTGLSGHLLDGEILVISSGDNGASAPERREQNMSETTYTRSLLATISALILGIEGQAYGEEVAGADDSVVVLDTVTVSATRRETNVQTTAISINTVSGGELEGRNMDNVAQFVGEIPGVTAVSSGPVSNRIIIRNVATSSQEAGSPTTATYFDEFALEGDTASALKLTDISQVEVLKGPQGTLFGRSAMGGSFAIFPTGRKCPVSLEGSTPIPRTRKMAARTMARTGISMSRWVTGSRHAAFFYYYDNSGFLDNVELGVPDTNDEDTIGGRVALRWKATDALTIDATYINQSIKAAAFSSVTTTRDPGDLNVVGDEGPDVPYDLDARTYIWGIVPDFDLQTEILNLKVVQNFSGFSGTFLATHSKKDLDYILDQREFVGLRGGCACDYIGSDAKYDHDTIQEANTLEVRLVSDDLGFVDWIAGLYYEDIEELGAQQVRYLGPDTLLYGFLSVSDGDILIDTDLVRPSEEIAAYGELGFNFTEKTRFLVGYRASRNKYGTQFGTREGLFTELTSGDFLEDKSFRTEEDVSTYKIALEHSFTDDIFGYALASSGYRRGGINLPTLTSPGSTYDSDELWNYEAGLKTSWLDGRLIANVAGYVIDYTDIQLVVQDPVTLQRSTQNVGKVRVSGIEASLDYQVNSSLNISFSGSISNPELLEDVLGGDSGTKGDRLPASAKSNYAIAVDWSRPLSGKLDVFAGANYRYTGNRYNDFNLDLDVELPSYDLFDARLGMQSADGYRVSLFVDNLFDEKVTFLIDRQGSFFESVDTNRPRTIGGSLSYEFQ